MSLTYQLPDNLDKEIQDLEELIARCKKGEITPIELKVHRVPFGVYEQRDPDTYMVRIRCGGGLITPAQLKKVAEISSTYGTNWIHLTTRQELQVHFVELEKIVAVIRELKEVGLASRGGGGNTVRNIMAQEDAGIRPDEVFDITPYAIALTSRLVAENDSWTLPRKFKIAFSASPVDEGYATLADVGFIAREKDGKKGFKVYVAGGLGAKSMVGHLLFDFLPEEDVYAVTRAVKMLFWKHGNRRNKHAARLRFLWQTLGEEEFIKKFHEEYDKVKKKMPPALDIVEIDNNGVTPDLPNETVKDKTDFDLWKKRFVRSQKQKGKYAVLLPVELGFINNEQAVALAKFLEPFGENVIRMTKDQNFFIRNMAEKYLPHVYNFLKATMPNFNRPLILDKLLACAGASTCQMGICLSRGATRATIKMLDESGLDLDKLSELKINISGCPNSCGQHHAADLGFSGKVSRKGDKMYPAYKVLAGAVIRDGETRLAEQIGEVSARDLPGLVKDLLGMYLSRVGEWNNFGEYIQDKGREDLKQICARYKGIPEFEEDKNYYFDWEADKVFSLADRGKGECSAGLFDLIEMDLKNIKETLKKLAEVSGLKEPQKEEKAGEKSECLHKLVFCAARMLLITRGAEPKSEQEVYTCFTEHFIGTGLVDSRFEELFQIIEKKDDTGLLEREKNVHELAQRVQLLYEHMDNAFQFELPDGAASGEAPKPQKESRLSGKTASQPKIVKDFRGVDCPMNFVKTKLELSKLAPKEILEVWLDDGEPIANVPGSVKEEGHNILEQKKLDDYWSVVIEKR